MKQFTIIAAALTLLASFGSGAYAQDTLPTMPDPIKNLAEEGAQIRYLGRDFGLDAWITIKNGQEQYFYVKPDQSAFVMGVLFDPKGKMVTLDQVKRLRGSGDDLLDSLATEDFASANEPEPFEMQSPSERLFYDIENSNWVPIGQSGAPVIYSFIDPQCPHCHTFVNELRDEYLDKGKIQVRLIPVGFKDETRAQAAFLMATPDPETRWMRHLDGDENALPAKSEISQQGVQRNLAIMQSWKFNVTPMIVYRGKDGSVKIVRGKPKNIDTMIADIGARS